MGAMDPHIFAVAEEAFKQMTRFDQNQSLIVSGESGAGKTVSAKYAMRYFAMVGGSQTETQVERKVLASNPIMEAIGNAKTTRNDNSSRFGKYIAISFSKQNEIIGANMRTYLLEKSRVVFQASDERNYHVFYQICASSNIPEFKNFNLGDADDFFYTSQGQNPTINGVDDAEELTMTREALSLLGISKKDQLMVFQILAAILHFGNVKIRESDGETCEIPSKDKNLTNVCKLLGIEESQMRMWLCHRKITTVNEVLTKPLTANQASFAQDALAKHIYSCLFDWIVKQINKALKSSIKQHKFIGVLDIYGFETFEINSFEQFCINYANEKLQQIFNMHVFKLEQEEYVREEIVWSFIDFYDNQPCIDLIESKLGILDLLDEECKMPKGSDANWCQKLYTKHLGKANHFEKPRMSNMAFVIHHFADHVLYQADGFLEKNRDTVLEDHVNILKASEFELVAELFADPAETDKRTRSGSATVHALRQGPKSGGGSKQHRKSVGNQFRDSLFLLMETLNATAPHYIRCIKPNDDKDAFTFEPKRAVEQLRACGVLETIRISAAGYPSRWTYSEFFQRYRVLAKSKDIHRKDMKKTCDNVLCKVIRDEDKYRFGKTKIFFRAGQVAYLEKLRSDKLRACGVMIQKHVRGWLARSRYQKLYKSAMLIQRYGRGMLARRLAVFYRQTKSATRIQKTWRGFKARKHFCREKRAAIIIQSNIRGWAGRRCFRRKLQEHKTIVIQKYTRSWLARKRFHRIIRGIVLFQSHFRRKQAKKEFKKLKIEAKSVEHIKNVNKGLENKIIELQQRLDVKTQEVNHNKDKEIVITELRTKVEKLKDSSARSEKSTNRIHELEQEIQVLRASLAKEQTEKKDLISEKELLAKEYEKNMNKMNTEKSKMKEELDKANQFIKEEENKMAATIKEKVEAANKLLIAEFESERAHHQKLVREKERLQQRLENLHGEMQVLTSPQNEHKRTPSDISAISLESFTSSVSPDEKKEDGEEDAEKEEEENVDVGLVLKLQNRVSGLEREKEQLSKRLETFEDESPQHISSGGLSDSAFDALKMQELENENDKLKREVGKLMKTIADTTDFGTNEEVTPAGKEFMDQFQAMSDELERRREECLQLRALLAERSISQHAIAKESYGGAGTIMNEDDELSMAYKTQKELIGKT
ncbi:hypothetical protein ScPMuIL_002772 [Solemya velum]